MIMNEPYSEYQVQFIERQINTLGANIERFYDEQAEGLKATETPNHHITSFHHQPPRNLSF